MSARSFYGGVGRDTSNLLTVGEEAFSRELAGASTTPTVSQQMRLTYFTARKSETTTQVRLTTGGTAAAATPTLCRIGLYSIAANGGGTLVASTANDTALFSAANTVYTKSWSAPYAKVAGTRYAVALLVVTGVATPTFVGNAMAATAESTTVAPTLHAVINSQADLPASFVAGSLLASGLRAYAAILP